MIGRAGEKARPMARIVYDAERRNSATGQQSRASSQFRAGDKVLAVIVIKNDGTYPHRDIGEPLVHPGDGGIVRESWRFLGDVYYTVEFMAQSVFVIMRGREMRRIDGRA